MAMLLIVAPAAFVKPLQRLQKHKSRTGMPATIETLENIYAVGYPGDEAEQVKRFIADQYRDALCRYVMLVGDADVFPVRFTKTDREDTAAWNTAFFPTDLYYAALHQASGAFDTWDANGNGYYGELCGETGTGPINVDGVSLLPELAVGRVPASTLADVRRYVDKVIGYETNAGHASWPWSALLVATHDWNSTGWASGIQLRAAEGCLALFSTTLVITRGLSLGDRLAADAVTAAFNRGVGIVGYVGHGRNDSLALPTSGWGVADLADLTNTSTWPVVLASACDTAGFATLPPYAAYLDVNGVAHPGTTDKEIFTAPPPSPACVQNWVDPDTDLATHITVRTSAGAVAYYGGVTGMQYAEPVEMLLDGLSRCTTLGDAWREMVKQYYLQPGLRTSLSAPDWSAVARFHQPWKYLVFGDPSLRLRGVGTQDQALAVLTAAAT